MKAVFDKNCNCVAWYNEIDGMVYNIEMQWIGFVSKNYFFSKTTEWYGGMLNGTFVDKLGKPVAWIQGYLPVGTGQLMYPLRPMRPLTPLRPLRPLAPLRPLTPLTPLGGWSACSWNEFVL